MRRWLFCLFVSVFVVGLGGEAAAERVHVVARGESLSEIAARYAVDLDELRSWNALEGDTLRVGQAIEVERPSRDGQAVHRVRSGETLARIAHRYAVTVAHLVELNSGIRPDRVREGDEIVVGEGRPSESIGEPGAGSLRGATQLGGHAGFVVRNLERAYATRRTIDRLIRGFDALLRGDREAPRVRVHDLSLRSGGPIDDHHTHQSGRDVDLTYYQRSGCTDADGCPLRAVAPDELDARRQWRLLHHWIARREIEIVYVDHALQAELYREARRTGATREQLAEWFQYPRAPTTRVGLIRHFPNHIDHAHVRFACTPGEHHCSPATQGP
ncbi:MAG: penicillin-insensitive murein endopeptidase [Myxococcota bacterium]|nr:penicillin-insensitive murein endopeptidase [Myxococcota bacterium]